MVNSHMRAKHIFLPISLSLMLALLPAGAAEFPDDAKVGEAGDPDNLLFEGLQSIADMQIRRALAIKASYLLAAHPQANRQTFLATLREKVLAGFQSSGFPDARVDVHFDASLQKARVSVSEGPHFKADQIRVIGAKGISIPDLVRWFTTEADEADSASGFKVPGKASRPEDPMWKTGSNVDFTSAWATQAVAQVEACLAMRGYFFPRAKVELQRKPASSAADCVISILDAGPPGVINEIKVTGPRLHSAADIVHFLQLRKGQRLTMERLAEAHQELSNCGRFWYFTIMPAFAGEGEKVSSRMVDLLIDLEELEGVPHLNKPLTPKQQALVRLCEWFEQFPVRNEDLELKLNSTNKIPLSMRMLVSPKHGVLIESADLQGVSPVSAGFELTGRTIQFTAWASGVKMARENEAQGHVRLTLLPNNNRSDSNRFNLSFAAGFGKNASGAANRKSPLRFDIQFARAGLLRLANTNENSCRLEGSQLVISNEDFTLRADARSGRLLELAASAEGVCFQAQVGARIWGVASRDFERRAGGLTNIYVPNQEVLTFAGLVAAEILRWELTTSTNSLIGADERTRAVTALRKLLDPELLVAANDYFGGEKSNSFSVPPDDLDRAIAQDNFLTYLTGFMFMASTEFFPKHSWPWTVARETAFLVLNQGRHTGAELERLCESEQTGPIGFLATAQLLSIVDPEKAKAVALLGLTRLSARDFLRDCNLIFHGDSGLARSFARLTRMLRTLTEAELTALVNVLPRDEATLLRESAAVLRAQHDVSLDSVLSPVISKYWEQRLRSEVRASLIDLTKSKGR